MKYLSLTLVFFFLLSCGTDSETPSNEKPIFEILGLEGKIINEFDIYNNQLFIATEKGVYKKDLLNDSKLFPTGLEDCDVPNLTRLDKTIFVPCNDILAEDYSLMKSENDGETWEKVTTVFGIEENELIRSIFADTLNHILYAAGNFVIAASVDHGLTWDKLDGYWGAHGVGLTEIAMNELNRNLWVGGQNSIEELVLFQIDLQNKSSKFHSRLVPSPSFITEMIFDPLNSDKLTAGAEGGIIETKNNGETWEYLIEDQKTNRFYFGLVRDTMSPETMYSAGWIKSSAPQPFLLFRSRDNGVHWDTLKFNEDNLDFLGGVWDMVIYKGEIYAGLYKGGVVKITPPF